MKNIIKKSFYVGLVVSIFSGVISCEKDFTDIDTNIISNNQFNTKDTILEVLVANYAIDSVHSDNITTEPGQYLLGIYKQEQNEYEKIEASIISQLSINTNIKLVDDTYGTDTTVVSTIDTVFLKLPYQATLESNSSTGPVYTLDSIVGDTDTPFNLNIYKLNTYLNNLDPENPSKANRYSSNDPYEIDMDYQQLNDNMNYQFKPNPTDTIMYVSRYLNNKNRYDIDTVKLTTGSSSTVSIPFARIPLNEDKFKELFLDKYDSSDFDSQEAFNNYFRGVVLEATGDNGSLTSFNFSNTNAELNPSIEVYYTNTVLKAGTTVIDTIKKSNTFYLSGIRRNVYKMEDNTSTSNEAIRIQGAAGNEAQIEILNGSQLTNLREKNWLINDASLTFYIKKDADTASIPYKLHLYKRGVNENNTPILSQVKDSYSETTFGGDLERESNKPDRYNFRITDYISDLLSGETNYTPPLNLKVYNSTDLPVSDTIFRHYNWNPKAVTILNHSSTNGERRAKLKISYTVKK